MLTLVIFEDLIYLDLPTQSSAEYVTRMTSDSTHVLFDLLSNQLARTQPHHVAMQFDKAVLASL